MYKDLARIYKREGEAAFSIAVTGVVTCGLNEARKITEDAIEIFIDNFKKEKGNIMTPEYLRNIFKLEAEIARNCASAGELIQFCQAVNLFDTAMYYNVMNRDRAEEIARNAVNKCLEDINNEGKIHGKEQWAEVCRQLDLSPEDLVCMKFIKEEEAEEIEEVLYA